MGHLTSHVLASETAKRPQKSSPAEERAKTLGDERPRPKKSTPAGDGAKTLGEEWPGRAQIPTEDFL